MQLEVFAAVLVAERWHGIAFYFYVAGIAIIKFIIIYLFQYSEHYCRPSQNSCLQQTNKNDFCPLGTFVYLRILKVTEQVRLPTHMKSKKNEKKKTSRKLCLSLWLQTSVKFPKKIHYWTYFTIINKHLNLLNMMKQK